MTDAAGTPAAPPRPPPPCGILILAAGASRRMGLPKALLKVGGQPLLRRAVGAALKSGAGGPVAVVLGAHAELLRPLLRDLSLIIVENAGWSEGMGSSLRAGVAALLKASPGLEALIVALVDQPHFDVSLVERLRATQAATGRSIVATRLVVDAPSSPSGTADAPPVPQGGPPALFLRRHFEALLACAGDAGARSLLRECAAEVALVDAPDPADIDTPEDYSRHRDRSV